jgi:plasmid stability protein
VPESLASFAFIAYNDCMQPEPSSETWKTLTIRHIKASQKEQLRVRAARNGRSMESELRNILDAALAEDQEEKISLAEAIRRRFQPLGGIDDLPSHPTMMIGEPLAFEP